MGGKLYIHCGIHKTGTTSLQNVLAAKTDSLKAAGFLYPQAGRIGRLTGQHNLAWELTRDRRFDRRFGDLAALRREADGFDGDLIISSEDFETILRQPARWSALLQLAAELGRSPVLIIYLRDQTSYLESLYYQCLKAGLAEEYAVYFREALRTGAVVRREWEFQFDYQRTVEAAAALPGCEVRVRNYHAPAGPSVVSDFFAALGLPAELLVDGQDDLRAHQRQPADLALRHFYMVRTERKPTPAEAQAITRLAEAMGRPVTPPAAASQFAQRFAAGNRALCDRYGLPPQGLAAAPQDPPPGASNLARVFSLETQLNLQRVARLITAAEAGQAEHWATADQVVEYWAAWAKGF